MKRLFSIALFAVLCATCSGQMPPASYSTAYTYKNLTVFVIQGGRQIEREYLTLDEAMKQNKIVLHETGSVGQLSVDNKSDKYVFIMAGDIVKGGRQDRTMGQDMVLDPFSKNIPLESFCVEQSRWSRRGGENAAVFSSSENSLSNRSLKIAARSEKNQSKVWSEVAAYQTNSSEKVKANTQSNLSASSLQLTLENKQLKDSLDMYIRNLQPAFNENKDATGFVFFVNGKFSTMESFGNASLFKKLQAKLLGAAASEAFEQYEEKLKFTIPDVSLINVFTDSVNNAKEVVSQTSKNITEQRKTSKTGILFNIINTDAGKLPIHTSIYSNDGILKEQKPNQIQTQQYNIQRTPPSSLIRNR